MPSAWSTPSVKLTITLSNALPPIHPTRHVEFPAKVPGCIPRELTVKTCPFFPVYALAERSRGVWDRTTSTTVVPGRRVAEMINRSGNFPRAVRGRSVPDGAATFQYQYRSQKRPRQAIVILCRSDHLYRFTVIISRKALLFNTANGSVKTTSNRVTIEMYFSYFPV